MAKAKRKSARKSAKRAQKAPWDRKAPRGSGHTRLTPAKKAAAKRRARKAGRPYPNLVDNMRAAAGSKRRGASKRRKTAGRGKAR